MMDQSQLTTSIFARRFFALVLGSVAALAALRWMLTINFTAVRFKEELWYAMLPLLCGVACWYWMRPLTERLLFKDNKRMREFLLWTSIGTTVIVCVFSQRYITDAVASLVKVSTVEDIAQYPNAQYFEIESYDVPMVFVSDYDIQQTGSRRFRTYTITAYFLFPISSNTSGRDNNYPYWYALEFTKIISDKPMAQRENDAKQFLKTCTEELRDYDFKRAKFFERIPDSDQREYYLNLLRAKVYNTNAKEILLAHQEAFVADDWSQLVFAITTLIVGSLMFFVPLNFVKML